MKSDEGNTSVNTTMTEALGREPLLSFSRAENSAQFIQLLQALEQQEKRQGWPSLSTLKVEVQRCDKCSREYCSLINYRRHKRVEHRSKATDKDAAEMRVWIAEFWDKKISLETAKEVLSFKNVALEEVPGSTIIKALSTLVRKAGFSPLPQLYLKAGSDILEIIQGRPSRFPISSEDLFTILDYASEKTFLCGSAVEMQKYVFGGDPRKIGLETKNVVACASYLLEQKLIDAYRADKGAESLRFQKILMEEEEVIMKRRAGELEKKKQKKLRQREQKQKEQGDLKKEDVDETLEKAPEEMPFAQTSSSGASEPKIDVVDAPNGQHLSAIKHSNPDTMDSYFQTGFDSRQMDWDYHSNDDESEFIQARSRKWRRNELRKNQFSESSSSQAARGDRASKLAIDSLSSKLAVSANNSRPAQGSQSSMTGSPAVWGSQAKLAVSPASSVATQGSQASKITISHSKPHAAQSSQASKPTISPTVSPAAWGSQASKLTVEPSGSLAACGSLERKLAFPPARSLATQGPQAPKFSTAPTGSLTAWGSQEAKPAISSASSLATQGFQVPTLATAPSGSLTAWGSQEPKPAISPSSSLATQGFQVPTLTMAPNGSLAATGSQEPMLAISPPRSLATQGSQAPKLAIPPANTQATQGPQASKPAIAPTRSHEAQGSQPKPAISSCGSHVTLGSQASKLAINSHSSKDETSPMGSQATRGSTEWKIKGSPTSSHATRGSRGSQLKVSHTSYHPGQGSPASKHASVNNHGNRRDQRAASSSGHRKWSPKAEAEFDGDDAEARVQKEAPNEPDRAKEHEVVPSPIFDGDSLAHRVQKKAQNEPERAKEHEVVPSPTFDGDGQAQKVQKEAPKEPVQTEELSADSCLNRAPKEPQNEAVQTKNHNVVASPNFDRNGLEDRVEKETPNEAAQMKGHEAILSPTSKRESWADMVESEEPNEPAQVKEREVILPPKSQRESLADIVDSEEPKEPAQVKEREAIRLPTPERESCEDMIEKEAPNEPAQVKEHNVTRAPESNDESSDSRVKQERPSEPDQTKEPEVLIGSIHVPFGNLGPKEDKRSEARNTSGAEHQTPQNGVHNEPKIPDLVQSDTTMPTVKFWTDVLVPNGSRECIDFQNMKGNLFDAMDWESAIGTINSFLSQRWNKAVEEEHITVVSVPVHEDKDRAKIENCGEKEPVNSKDVGNLNSGEPSSKVWTRPNGRGFTTKYVPKHRRTA